MRIKILTVVFVAASLMTSNSWAFVDGIDVSRWQNTIAWNSVKADGIDFAFVKATDGVNFVDPQFHNNIQGATAAGILVGPYHFARVASFNGVPFTSYDGSAFVPGSDPYLDAESEANDFLDAITPYYDNGLYLPPVADVENLPDFGSTFLNREFISNWVEVFSDTINNTLGRRPIIYTSKFGANTRYTNAVASSHDLWLAWWKNSTTNPPVISDTPQWNPWDFWQWTDTGSVNGISGNVDRDVFDGTQQQLEQLLIGNGAGNPSNIISITNFATDEGYFKWSTNFSGSNQGIGAGSSADRVTTEAYEGSASQRIVINGDAGGWLLRHVAGLNSPAANPSTNLILDATGYVGFWLKTEDAGIEVQIAIDDPLTADRGISQDVIADGEWHLYEWDFEDDSQWEAWVSEDGVIDGPTVTIDSIQFRGAGDATFYLDAVSHNPLGSLAPLVGDFDHDGDVDDVDLAQWVGDFGIDADSDADQDGDTDGADFLAWQRNLSTTAIASQAVPEPATILMLAWGIVVCCGKANYVVYVQR